MTSQIQLKITWDGPVKGLEQHRVSLEAFGGALALLVAAVRRIASNLLSNAAEPAQSGRLAAAAKNVDILITETVKGSGGFETILEFDLPVSAQAELFSRLPENVGIELLAGIEAESAGTERNLAVRRYLQALPSGLTFQHYDLHENGRSIKNVKVGRMDLPKLLSEPLPSLFPVDGRVTGVGFEPRWEIKVRGENGSQVTASASEKQVNHALALRSEPVHALALNSEAGSRLLVLHRGAAVRPKPDVADIFDRWDATFRALA